MKKIIAAALAVMMGLALASCGPNTYKTMSGGQDNVSYIIVVKQSGDYKYDNVSIVVDDEPFLYGEVYKIKKKRKAPMVIVDPGKHNIKVVIDGRTVSDENVFLGLQETKTIILK